VAYRYDIAAVWCRDQIRCVLRHNKHVVVRGATSVYSTTAAVNGHYGAHTLHTDDRYAERFFLIDGDLTRLTCCCRTWLHCRRRKPSLHRSRSASGMNPDLYPEPRLSSICRITKICVYYCIIACNNIVACSLHLLAVFFLCFFFFCCFFTVFICLYVSFLATTSWCIKIYIKSVTFTRIF